VLPHAERRERGGELVLAVRRERRPVPLEGRELVADHLAALAARAGHDRHRQAGGGARREERTRRERLVVGVRVDRDDAAHALLVCPHGAPA